MDNLLYIPSLNPVSFYNQAITQPAAYQTKQFDDYEYYDRGQFWQEFTSFERIWQTTDIIYLQFESSFDPITIELVNQYNQSVITLSAITGLPNKYIPNTYAFEVALSLAGLQTGCYKLKGTFGTGSNQLIMYSAKQFISSTPIPNTILVNYYNSKWFKDVIFETGIQFQIRVQGFIDDDNSTRSLKQEQYRNQQYSSKILTSKSNRVVPVHFGDFYGLPVDMTDLLEQIFECDNVTLDGKLFGLAEGSKAEYTTTENYRLRGLKMNLEPNLSRSSRVYALGTNTNLPLFVTTIVDAKVFGDTANQGSNNTVPVYNNQTS